VIKFISTFSRTTNNGSMQTTKRSNKRSSLFLSQLKDNLWW